jgi:hypothetical protein
VKYETPRITDFGSIGQSASVTPDGQTADRITCPLDPLMGVESCREHP